MSKEGDLLVKLRLLMVLRGFNLEWLISHDIITDDRLEKIREMSERKKRKKKA